MVETSVIIFRSHCGYKCTFFCFSNDSGKVNSFHNVYSEGSLFLICLAKMPFVFCSLKDKNANE